MMKTVRFSRSLAVTVVVYLLLTICLAGTADAQSSPEKSADKKEIALTFDEVPAAVSFEDPDRMALSYLVLQALDRHEVKAAGFVVGSRVEGDFDILGEWLNRGHAIGNLTWSNQDLNELGIEQFIASIRKGGGGLEEMLEGFGQVRRYFRYPYLRYGTSTEAKRQVTMFLEHRDYTVAHASVVPEDYLYNLTLQKLGRTPDSAEYESLLNEYINSVLDEIERCETVAKQLVGRPVKHILALRMNRLNAVYLDEMLGAIKDMGYTFVGLDEALSDEIYERPEGYFGGRGVGWLDMLSLSDPDLTPAQ
jgi:peptidoglycan/xylan/chitin deacetylase (PgdA/CDA1 family)